MTMVPPAPFRFTREMYHRLGEMGLFDGIRVELLDGEIVRMSPQNPAHAGTISALTPRLLAALGEAFTLRAQLPIELGEDSEPEPDFAVCDRDPRSYFDAHPAPAQVHLIIEVAVSSLDYDRGRKRAAYARAGIPAYWLANLTDRVVEVYTGPEVSSGRYLRAEVRRSGDRLEPPSGATVDVGELLPPPETPPKV